MVAFGLVVLRISTHRYMFVSPNSHLRCQNCGQVVHSPVYSWDSSQNYLPTAIQGQRDSKCRLAYVLQGNRFTRGHLLPARALLCQWLLRACYLADTFSVNSSKMSKIWFLFCRHSDPSRMDQCVNESLQHMGTWLGWHQGSSAHLWLAWHRGSCAHLVSEERSITDMSLE